MHQVSADSWAVWTFRTALGWTAMAGRDETLFALTFGHGSAEMARERLADQVPGNPREIDWNHELRRRLQDYADGAPVEFQDVDVALDLRMPFTRAVIEACRRIPYGETASYGELATQVGAPRAGRAVGNVMRTNRCPIVVPCHRVVHGDGRIGRFSAPQGATMKERLLAMEAASHLVGATSLQRLSG